MDEERIGPDTLRLLTQYYGSLVRRLERLIAAEQPDLSPSEIARAVDLRIATEAARWLLASGARVTRLSIFEILEEDQPGLLYETLLQRWKRHDPPLTLRSILAEATR